ncbi:MAG: hypothetical protein RQ862_00330 [Candidatus Caldarchaeales archaeon]|nr:hypothetical protein [Candidatus Caldarchaeales archaeon]
MRRIANYIGVELELKEYKSFKLTSGEIGIVFNTVEIEESKRPSLYTSREDKLNNIKDDKIRSLAMNFLKDLEDFGFEARNVHDE